MNVHTNIGDYIQINTNDSNHTPTNRRYDNIRGDGVTVQDRDKKSKHKLEIKHSGLIKSSTNDKNSIDDYSVNEPIDEKHLYNSSPMHQSLTNNSSPDKIMNTKFTRTLTSRLSEINEDMGGLGKGKDDHHQRYKNENTDTSEHSKDKKLI